MVKQGNIILVNFDPTIGHEQQKTRPALIVSNDIFNSNCSGLVAVCPISHANDFPLHVELETGLKVDGKILCQHLRVLDIKSRGYKIIDNLSNETLEKVLKIINGIFD